MKNRFLIVTADDFGLHPAVNDAVEQASRNGILTAASLMVSAPAAADAVNRARRLPDLCVGLHLVVADGWAELPPQLIPRLADSRGFLSDHMLRRSVLISIDFRARRQLEAEIQGQFAAFARTGLPLDHVNVHKHLQLHPTVLGMVIRFAREYGARAIRVPAEPLWFATRERRWLAALTAGMLRPLNALMKHRVRAAALIHNDWVFGIARSGAMGESSLLAIFRRLPPGITEIYMHPASAATISATMAGYRHQEELAALTSERVRRALEDLHIRCGGYGDLAHPSGR